MYNWCNVTDWSLVALLNFQYRLPVTLLIMLFIYFQPESGGGNCLFGAIKASMGVHHAKVTDSPYYLTRYFH